MVLALHIQISAGKSYCGPSGFLWGTKKERVGSENRQEKGVCWDLECVTLQDHSSLLIAVKK